MSYLQINVPSSVFLFTIQQIQSYALTFLEFLYLSLKSDELFVSAWGIFLTKYQLLNWINVLSNLHLTGFTTAGFATHSTPAGLIKLHQQLIQRRWRPDSVRKLVDKLLNFSLHNFHYRFSFFDKNIVYYCLHNSDMSTTSTGTRQTLFVLVTRHFLVQNSISSHMVHTSNSNFVYSFQMNYKIPDTNWH